MNLLFLEDMWRVLVVEICIVNEYSFVKDVDDDVLVEFDFLIDMSFMEDVTLIVNSLQDLR